VVEQHGLDAGRLDQFAEFLGFTTADEQRRIGARTPDDAPLGGREAR